MFGNQAISNSIELNISEQAQERANLRQRKYIAFALVAPLLLFIFFSFVAPIASMLYRSVYNPEVITLIPQTTAILESWDGQGTPDNDVLNTMALELKALAQDRKAGSFAAAVNRSWPGASSLINSSARKMRPHKPADLATHGHELLIQADKRWRQPDLWLAIREVGKVYTDTYYLTALDLERDSQGSIQARSSAKIYIQLYIKTLVLAITITLLCILLGYPLSYYLAHAPKKTAGILMVFVLLPFWTSLLVRTTAWIALLQTNGVVNSILMYIGIIAEPLEILYTRHATIIAMTHILLPFMILPLYSVMRSIDESYVRAALSMGSRPLQAFYKIYLPLSLPGLGAGSLLVFIISVGYYITPALVGGTDGQMISNLIAFHMQQSNNWGLAAALGVLLLILILTLYWVYDRLVGTSNIKLG